MWQNSMLHKWKKSIGGRIALITRNNIRMERTLIADVALTTTRGTVRKQPDQDDAWYFSLAGESEAIFDIGANTGYTALLAKVQDPIKKLLLVEPNPEALSRAARNLIINNLSEWTVFVSAFASNVAGDKIQFYTVGAGAAGSMFKGHAESAAMIGSSYMVPTTTIDTLVAKMGWVPDLVKIDVEGAECLVLSGGTTLAAQKRTRFLVEMHSAPELPMLDNAIQVLEWCCKNHYKAWYMKEGTELIKPEMIAKRGRCHLLLQPTEWDYPDHLNGIFQFSSLPNT